MFGALIGKKNGRDIRLMDMIGGQGMKCIFIFNTLRYMCVTAEPATARILIVKLPYTLVTEEAERIGLDHGAKISVSSDSDYTKN